MQLKFRKLKASEIDIRVGRVIETEKFSGVSLLLYKDARVDQDILDETVGPMNWQRQHSRDNANCQVGIYDTDKNQWVWKEDTGTESNTEAEKGLASDSFKRACVNWGIGRELYSAKNIVVACEIANKKPKSGIAWFVKEIKYKENCIVGLKIAQTSYGKNETIVYTMGESEPSAKIAPPSAETPKGEQQADKPFDIPPAQKLTLEEALEIKVNTRNGFKLLKDLSDEQLEVIIRQSAVEEWKEGAKLILIFRSGQKC